MKKILAALVVATVTLTAGIASAHMFWVNVTESLNHPPGHVLSSLGFGHVLPVDDFLVNEYGVIKVGKYQVVDPNMKAADLGLPDTTKFPTDKTSLDLNVTRGTLAARKIALKPETRKGTYLVTAESVPMFFTGYVNTKGKNSIAPKPMDAIKDLGKVQSSFKYQSFAKSYFTVGEWTKPKPMGHDLEIIPLTDMSNIRVGDLVQFDLKFHGKPVNTDDNNIRTLTCSSNAFGGPDKFSLSSMVMNGKAQFRMPAAGQWVANIYYPEKVADNPTLKDLKGKCTLVYTAATITFNVKP